MSDHLKINITNILYAVIDTLDRIPRQCVHSPKEDEKYERKKNANCLSVNNEEILVIV